MRLINRSRFIVRLNTRILFFGALAISFPLFGQQVNPNPGIVVPQVIPQGQPNGQQNQNQQLRPNYVLGPNDQIILRAFEVEEINEKPFRIDTDGSLILPLVGVVKAAGLTVQELEADLVERLKKYVKDPHVTVNVIQFRSDPVFFVGQFQKPGIWPLEGSRTLVEMLSTVGGLQPTASRHIRIIRRAEAGVLPLPNVVVDTEKKVSTAEININALRDNVNPAEDIVLEPYDTVSVDRAEQIFVQGEIGRVGALDLGERESISVLQVLTLVGGMTKEADGSRAEILRPVLNTSRRAEIRIDLNLILATRANDVPLMPNDILYVPKSKGLIKPVLTKAVLIAIPIMTSFIYLAFR